MRRRRGISILHYVKVEIQRLGNVLRVNYIGSRIKVPSNFRVFTVILKILLAVNLALLNSSLNDWAYWLLIKTGHTRKNTAFEDQWQTNWRRGQARVLLFSCCRSEHPLVAMQSKFSQGEKLWNPRRGFEWKRILVCGRNAQLCAQAPNEADLVTKFCLGPPSIAAFSNGAPIKWRLFPKLIVRRLKLRAKKAVC